MGTWNASILGNDTSAEVYDTFFHHWDRGATFEEIEAVIDDQFATSLGDVQDCHNVLFARALASWEIGRLSPARHAEVRAALTTGEALAAYASLEAGPQMILQRTRAIEKLAEKLAVPRPSARKRKKPPVPLASKFVVGACLAYSRSQGGWGGMIAIDSGLYARRGSLSLAATTIAQAARPTFADFERSHLQRFAWEEVSVQAARYASPNGMTGRLSVLGVGYDGTASREAFFALLDPFFDVVGRWPKFTQVLLGTSGGSFGSTPTAFAKTISDFESFGADEPASGVSLGKLAILLSTRVR